MLVVRLVCGNLVVVVARVVLVLRAVECVEGVVVGVLTGSTRVAVGSACACWLAHPASKGELVCT